MGCLCWVVLADPFVDVTAPRYRVAESVRTGLGYPSSIDRSAISRCFG